MRDQLRDRPLRTDLPVNPRTRGERLRYARISNNLSQQQFARGIKQIAGGSVSKSMVSQWEVGGVKNPSNANMLAIQSITGFSMEWIVNGRGPQRVSLPSSDPNNIAPLDVVRLAKAMKAANPGLEDADVRAKVVAGLYDLLGDTPDVSPAHLARFAAALSKA